MIALITPTGARPAQIELCAKFMQAQTYAEPVLWIIVDDAEPVTTDFIKHNFKLNWTILKVYPAPPWRAGQNTQGRNIMAGLNALRAAYDLAKIKAIYIIEDDDYYSPPYLHEMRQRLEGYDIAGELYTVYYNVTLRCWLRNHNIYWSSLFQTAFTVNAIPALERVITKKFIDCHFFPAVTRKNMFFGHDYAVGIKGQQGRCGIGMGHKPLASYINDPLGLELYKLIGDDVKHYIHDWDYSNVQHP